MAKNPKEQPGDFEPKESKESYGANSAPTEGSPAPAEAEWEHNSYGRHVKTRSHKELGSRVYSPGTVELYRSAEWALVECARERKMKVLEVTHVRASRRPGETRIYIYPVKASDPEAMEIKRGHNQRGRVNLGPYLTQRNLALPVGLSQRFQMFFEAPSGLGPAIYFDLDKPTETTRINKRSSRNKKASQQAPDLGTDPGTESAPA